MQNTDTLNLIELPELMRAIVLDKPNNALSLSEVQIPLPHCGDQELIVKVEYVGLNPTDVELAKKGFCQWHYPHIMGFDAVGTVVQAKKGLFPTVGDRVMWHANIGGQGVLSEYASVPNFAVSVVPDSVTGSDAATLPCAGMTALIAMKKLQIIQGESIFIDAGAGAVGQFAIQFAKQLGADVFTTAAKRNHKLVTKLGADVVFDYQDKKLADKLSREVGPQGFDAVLDSLGGETTARNIELMRFCGRIACLKPLPLFEPALMFRKAPNIGIISLAGAWLCNSLCAQQKMGFLSKELLEAVAQGNIIPPKVTSVDFNADNISAALHRQINGGFTGKQIIKIT
ncbi:zinc-binding dehydrogenase [Colwellia sp. E2M01]|uniref:zinc-binding dehydrogenase n=1 Tax=Colwellia sp. E2M01 TaxID=2841561 RepID=UPI001C092F4C|nr:zinc-binding dehydrogenase [Colwellia sp. E2M01]MBU2869847.1 zinc-binding dehydrogenase [Colwellia sp. E2M01]